MGDATSSPVPVGREGSKELTGLRRILVGFSERPASRDALVLAEALARPTGAELIVASVRPYWSDLLGAKEYMRAVAEDEKWLGREARKTLDGDAFSTRVIGGNHDGGGLKEIAAAEKADLIVVGSTHRGAIGRVMPGSFGERVLDNAPCGVGVAPLGLADSGLELHTIAVAYDGSQTAGIALQFGYEVAESFAASLLVLGAVDFNPDVTGLQPVSAEQHDEARMIEHLERAERAAPKSVPVRTRLLHGIPNRVLLAAAEDADLLVLGSRGHYGRARRLFMGSVATQVARNAPCATLITASA